MANKKILGIDIGNYRVKLAVCVDGVPVQCVNEQLPDNMVKEDRIVSWDAMGDFLKEIIKKHGIRCKNAAIALPGDLVYVRRVALPLMTVNQLAVNLPYEFHDYILEDMDKYIYDYAVLEIRETEMELLAVAAQKEMILRYTDMCKRAGLKLRTIAPDVMGYHHIIHDYENRHQVEHGSMDYAVLDLGDRTIKLHFFTKGEYEVTRSLEPGCRAFAESVAGATGKDLHIARIALETGAVQDEDQSEMQDMYGTTALQIMRVLNFYSFNNPNNTIDTLYYCGGGAYMNGLMAEVAVNTGLEQKSLSELVEAKPEFDRDMTLGPLAFGITLD